MQKCGVEVSGGRQCLGSDSGSGGLGFRVRV